MVLLIKLPLINLMENYELELEKLKEKIKEKKAKTVLIQLPDGLKPKAVEISEKLKETGAKIYIWAGSCFGACDIPNTEVDLIVQFGHNEFK